MAFPMTGRKLTKREAKSEREFCVQGHYLLETGRWYKRCKAVTSDGERIEKEYLVCLACNRASARRAALRKGVGQDLRYARSMELRARLVL